MFNFSRTYKLPFIYDIPNYIGAHLRKVPKYKRVIKFFKRYLIILFLRQKNLEVFSILLHHKNILWINISAPSLGDSLMDLSSRVMLANKNVDLFTSKKNAHIYSNDKIFNNVYIETDEVDKNFYDIAILDSYSSRSMRIKTKILPSTPFVGMFGFFNGPEVNRIFFSFHQMNNLLGYVKTEKEITNIASNTITVSKEDEELVSTIVPKKYLAITLGGEWNYKIYNHWGDLIEKIFENYENIDIVLIGSKNAEMQVKEILERFSDDKLINLVFKLTFNQTAEVIRNSQVLFCCDGGLMHAANAVNAEVIVLLGRLLPEMLFTNDKSNALFDKEDVNNIKVEDVFKKYDSMFNSFDNRLQGE
jgi:hypothetical protein